MCFYNIDINVIPFFIVYKIIHKKQCNLSIKAFSIIASKALINSNVF